LWNGCCFDYALCYEVILQMTNKTAREILIILCDPIAHIDYKKRCNIALSELRSLIESKQKKRGEDYDFVWDACIDEILSLFK
jgi:hypothetical protein